MNIAIFGGSFDPPHNGHLAVVKKALKALDIGRLIIVPAFLNPFKSSSFAPPALRLKWCKQLFKKLKSVEISEYEISQNRPVASIQTIKHFKALYNPNKIYLIIGADNLASLNKWQDYDELCELCEFVVAARDDIQINKLYKTLKINEKISSSFIRNQRDFSKIPPKIKADVSAHYSAIYAPGEIKSELKNAPKREQMQERINRIIKILDDKKAQDIASIDMSGREYIAKYVIIATTLHARHAASLIDELATALKPHLEQFLGSESSDEWSVIDLGDIIVHLMSQNYRAKYNIEDFLDKLKKGF